MKDMQEVFDQIQELKQTKKEIAREYRDILAQDQEFQELKEELATLRDKKKVREQNAQIGMGRRWEEYERAVSEIAELDQMLTDIAMTNLMDGKSLNLKDKHDTEYEPSYKIVFKKID
ncbi:MAG: hypothetical protein HGA38_04770 [Candidatus Moranbacteria bacterium]|nr:hypothetical protein [Candidatus Moranbacteria bacterium]NTW46301.1 hypothetical protein [Candidatus Moranbacteria bacterium]